MEDIISKIIYIETLAESIIKDVEHKKVKKENELIIKLKDLKESLLSDTNKKIEITREKELKELEKHLVKMEEENLEKINEMQLQYEENIDNWVDELVDAVIKR